MSMEYRVIKNFYGARNAQRSGKPLIAHIDEGLDILKAIKAPEKARKGYCIHPLVQNNEQVDVTWSVAYDLACEYRDRANSYLCRPENDSIITLDAVYSKVGSMSRMCAMMLFADKLQNQLDFLRYHQGHERAPQLHRYFALWIAYLTPMIGSPK